MEPKEAESILPQTFFPVPVPLEVCTYLARENTILTSRASIATLLLELVMNLCVHMLMRSTCSFHLMLKPSFATFKR